MGPNYTQEFLSTQRKLLEPFISQLIYLYGRWLDEREYEDFNEYIDFMKSNFEKLNITDSKFIKAGKHPFGCLFSVSNTKMLIQINTRKWKLSFVK